VRASAISLDKPPYPEECRRRSQEGTVRLRVLVLSDGTVGRAELARSSGIAAFDRAAVEGARRWRFRPARRAEAAVDDWVTLSVVFRLEDGQG
jgi:protein TonB